MAKIALTAPRVAGFSCPPGKAQAFLWDSKAPGLGLRATPRGTPAFIFQSVYQGKSLRITIGDAQRGASPTRKRSRGNYSVKLMKVATRGR